MFALSVGWCLSVIISLINGEPDSYRHEHVRLAMLSLAVTLMAGAGLARRNRLLHVGLFAGGGLCLAIAVLLR